ncbi:MAG: FAD-binding protein [Bacteroidota bacterium]|nr:FAD-binding protein [Bacteroidota bacterium]
MPITLELKLTPEQAASEDEIKWQAADMARLPLEQIAHLRIVRKSLDARKTQIIVLLKVEIFQPDETFSAELRTFKPLTVSNSKTCHIIGFGPGGIYAALQLLELGIKPIIIERGKDVQERRRDLADINRKLIVNPDSNYCFGEGGAGTYSDGKLYTRSTKRGDIKKVLDVFIQHGANERIGYEAHPHIGTNKLPGIIENMRRTILEKGGEVHFNKRVSGFNIKDGTMKSLLCADGSEFDCQHVILATGHSSRDIFELLNKESILIEAKPFAVGVRIEHEQTLIDSIQYKRMLRGEFLPPSSYSLVTQALGRGVFSFCMCPGGIIAPASTSPGETVVNGWSPSKRNGRFANSGIVVAVNPENWIHLKEHGPLAALQLQKQIEQKAFSATGSIKAPAQRMEDFIQDKLSSDLPDCSYVPGIIPAELSDILPSFISKSLKQGLIDFGNKMRGYRTNEAVLVGVESRTSSPVRIPRDKETFRHPQISNLFPCGEGAGYAGGIVSAAMDGMACANAVNS